MIPVEMTNGKFRGWPLTRIPLHYLKWMVSVGHELAEEAKEELERRGTKVPKVSVSAHALDRASTRCLGRYLETRKSQSEGLHTWLGRMADSALTFPENPKGTGRHPYMGLIFVFSHPEGGIPVLVTVMIPGDKS